jgi:hypothetical protein
VLSSRLAHYLAEQLARAGISPGAGAPPVVVALLLKEEPLRTGQP